MLPSHALKLAASAASPPRKPRRQGRRGGIPEASWHSGNHASHAVPQWLSGHFILIPFCFCNTSVTTSQGDTEVFVPPSCDGMFMLKARRYRGESIAE
ncbi:MAG: hypothetical protein ATN36_04110 [Epulopiscium sp. Nele67-Bin005]|nr:MAG: hypothetical protein ATN36_04110 [Epulopiscium sp. Nele67-Bin005]